MNRRTKNILKKMDEIKRYMVEKKYVPDYAAASERVARIEREAIAGRYVWVNLLFDDLIREFEPELIDKPLSPEQQLVFDRVMSR